eukprot:158623-Prymnesium_polylepis.3
MGCRGMCLSERRSTVPRRELAPIWVSCGTWGLHPGCSAQYPAYHSSSAGKGALGCGCPPRTRSRTSGRRRRKKYLYFAWLRCKCSCQPSMP